jgi:hypothetical protein
MDQKIQDFFRPFSALGLSVGDAPEPRKVENDTATPHKWLVSVVHMEERSPNLPCLCRSRGGKFAVAC